MSGRRWALFVVWAAVGATLGWGLVTVHAPLAWALGVVLLVVAVLLTTKTPHAAHTLAGLALGGVVVLFYGIWDVGNSEGEPASTTWPNGRFFVVALVVVALVTAVFAALEQRARREPRRDR